MATIEEMANVVYDTGATPIPKGRVKDSLRCAMQSAEYYGVYYNSQHGVDPCTVWVVGAYEVTYLTDDGGFHAGMLTDEMMDDLIIKEI